VIFHDPIYEHALKDRDWAPAGGTSMNRARDLNDDLTRRFTVALREAVDAEPGMHGSWDGSLPWVWVDGDELGGWWIGHGISHEIEAAEDDLKTFLWADYVTDAEPPVERPRAINVTLAGPGARDETRLARMVVEALRPYVPK
jgi:hypothetical protein